MPLATEDKSCEQRRDDRHRRPEHREQNEVTDEVVWLVQQVEK